ncbi:uncharacterized protein DFL_003423 [Arthrobotrys flagrans]|uniref:Wax synthase domain-containing protein n=1 Tax=Arthrobotrys flagrans TaxID=97331 RepID=A0A437A1W5_ARTFL|nr:hypothetical protein DFL_003423 [Arthrobotrys flagrans]
MALTTLQLACLTTPFLTITILSLPPSSFLRQCLYPLPALLFLHPLLFPPKFAFNDNNAIQEAFKLGTLYASFLFAFCHYLYAYGYNTPNHFWKVKRIDAVSSINGNDGERKENEKEEFPETLWGRVKWALGLITTLRGVGWNFQISTLPETKFSKSRGQCEYFVYGISIFLFKTFVCGVWDRGRRWGDEREWYRMFGRFEDCWSVRSVWGRVWHQSIRKCIQVPGDKLADLIFGTNPTSLPVPIQLLRRFFLLLSAFSISGLIHASGSYFIVYGMNHYNPPPNTPPWYYTFYFFISQAFVIAIEEIVFWTFGVESRSDVVKKGTIRWGVGVLYTSLWFGWCTTVLWADPESRVVGFEGGRGEGYAHVLERIDKF